MKRRRSNSKAPLPHAPGWYRVSLDRTETLRYFNGLTWTDKRREAPFWLEGPEWTDLFSPKVELDSDNPIMVSRNPLNQGARQLHSRPFTPRIRSRSRFYLAIVLAIAMLGLSGTSYISQLIVNKPSLVGKSTAVPLITSPALVKAISNACAEFRPEKLPSLDLQQVNNSNGTNAEKLRIAKTYLNSITLRDFAMNGLASAPGEQDAMSAWDNLWNVAATNSRSLVQAIAAHKSIINSAAALETSLSSIKRFSTVNSLNSCAVFLT